MRQLQCNAWSSMQSKWKNKVWHRASGVFSEQIKAYLRRPCNREDTATKISAQKYQCTERLGKGEGSSCLMLGLAVVPSLHLLGPASNWVFMQWDCQERVLHPPCSPFQMEPSWWIAASQCNWPAQLGFFYEKVLLSHLISDFYLSCAFQLFAESKAVSK